MPKKSINILYIEDDGIIRELAAFQLQDSEEDSFQLITSEDLSEGLVRLENDDVDVILLGLNAPDGSGLSALSSVRDVRPDLPIVVYAGLDDEETGMEALKRGADDYVIKCKTDRPFLLRSLRYAVERKRFRQKLHIAHDEPEKRVVSQTEEHHKTNKQIQRPFDEKRKSDKEPLHRMNMPMNVSDAVIVCDADMVITSWNSAAESVYGFCETEVMGHTVDDILWTQYLSENRKDVREHLCEKGMWQGEIRQTTKDGRLVNSMASISVINDGDGVTVGLVIMNQDVTTYRKTIEALRDSEEKWRNLMEIVSDPIIIVGVNEEILDCNQAFLDQFGYTRYDLADLRSDALYQKANEDETLSRLLHEQGTIKNHNLICVRKDGSVFEGIITAKLMKDLYENIVGYQGIVRNVTKDRKFISGTLRSITDGVITLDHDYRIILTNPAAEEIFNIPKERMLGKKYDELFRDTISQDGYNIKRAVLLGESLSHYRTDILSDNTNKVPVSINVSVLREENGEEFGSVITIRDLSVIEELRKEISSKYTFADIVSRNNTLFDIMRTLPSIAESDSNLLIEGKSGTGKDLFASAVHNRSHRRDGPFIVLNCAAIPDSLMESEMFGYTKGAFTDAKTDKQGYFARADGGTLLLDEIGEIPKTLQAKLLRLIEEKTFVPLGASDPVRVDVRIIASTNKDLALEVMKGHFREDLFFRLNVVRICIPDLKKRKEDIPLLVEHFLKKFNIQKDKGILGITDDAMEILMKYDYPGNVRELKNIVEYACIICDEKYISRGYLPKDLVDGIESGRVRTLKKAISNTERQLIVETLSRFEGDRQKTAHALDMHRGTLWRKMKEYQIN
ncbi:MAG: sigma 54-interacting transcriptional regulator [Deltaproteobacteria bacterium]|nr:sigma 54-interacting transcriptional regulator [Candidatus Zymogenaceae bacterium]